jgi:BlaI family transcriptional regulator, penicillinase repressor
MDAGLGPLEMRILGLLDTRDARSVADVRDLLAREGHAAAYTTVMTVLGRLFDKGLVRREKQGPRYVYFADRRARGFKGRLLRRVQKSLFPEKLAPIAALLDQNLDRSELEALKRLIEEKMEQSK